MVLFLSVSKKVKMIEYDVQKRVKKDKRKNGDENHQTKKKEEKKKKYKVINHIKAEEIETISDEMYKKIKKAVWYSILPISFLGMVMGYHISSKHMKENWYEGSYIKDKTTEEIEEIIKEKEKVHELKSKEMREDER